MGDLELPTFVIERADLVGGEAAVVDERGEQELRLESFALVANGACIEVSWVRILCRAEIRSVFAELVEGPYPDRW